METRKGDKKERRKKSKDGPLERQGLWNNERAQRESNELAEVEGGKAVVVCGVLWLVEHHSVVG